MDTRSFEKLVVLNMVLLSVYIIADWLSWVMISSIPIITHVYWNPLNLQIDVHLQSGANGGINTNDAPIGTFVLVTIGYLALAYAGTPKYGLISALLLGAYALGNSSLYLVIVNFMSNFQQINWGWNPLFITAGNSTNIIPNLALLVAAVATIMNIMYVRRFKTPSSSFQAQKQEKATETGYKVS